MNRFKVGDTIKCVNNENQTDLLTVGKTYTIKEVWDCGDVQVVGDDAGRASVFFRWRFILVD
jgi:hypothetical protein